MAAFLTACGYFLASTAYQPPGAMAGLTLLGFTWSVALSEASETV